MLERLLILGTGVFAEDVADLVADTDQWIVEAFVEGLDRRRCGQTLLGRPILWIEDLAVHPRPCRAVCAVGSPARRAFIASAEAHGVEFVTLVHPTARVPASAAIAPGAILSAGVVLGAQVRIGPHVILNRGCLVGHHVQIGAYATIGPGCNIGGLTRVGEACSIGIGAIIVDRLSLGAGASVGAGALVTRDVPDRTRVIGSPARAVRADPSGSTP
ncbi:MAG TPA: NeuD/PglB/VioB family sugar acetyltransferase [Vicinamibacterales bacterium]